jgi:signal transduction histidine kinase
MRPNSLAFRLFATAAAWAIVALPIAGLIIYSLFRQQVSEDFDARLFTLLTAMYPDSMLGAEKGGTEPGPPGQIGEGLFEITHSGWYWQIKPADGKPGRVRVSPSLATGTIATPFERGTKLGEQGAYWGTAVGPVGDAVRVAEVIFPLGDEATGRNFSFIVTAPLDWIDERVRRFRTRLVTALALTGLGLVAVTLFQVRFGLAPLRTVEQSLAAIRSGEKETLDGDVPAEIRPLQHELNALITSNQEIIDRARTHVGNLAHALKTPLAVITNEARDSKDAYAQKVAEQAAIMRDQISHHLDRARVAARVGTVGRVTEVEPVVAALSRALERIYRDKGVRVAVSLPPGLRFQGEKHDLEEMLGNLMDNACKWARGEVAVSAMLADGEGRDAMRRLVVLIEDDGPGLPEELRAKLGERGLRLDETKPGSGLGLSIVSELAHSYRGAFVLEASGRGGLAARLTLPAV